MRKKGGKDRGGGGRRGRRDLINLIILLGLCIVIYNIYVIIKPNIINLIQLRPWIQPSLNFLIIKVSFYILPDIVHVFFSSKFNLLKVREVEL